MHLALSDTSVPHGPSALVPATPSPASLASLDDDARVLLGLLRARAAVTCLRPRIDPFVFSAEIVAKPERSLEAYLEAVLRVAPLALGRPMRFYNLRAQAVSFDEAWLLSLVGAFRRGDHHSVRFALISRVGEALRRPLAKLAHGLAKRLDDIT